MVDDVARQKRKPKRVPICAQTRAWPIFDAGYKLTEALSDYDKMFDVVCRMHEVYEFDLYMDQGGRFPYKVLQELGKTQYIFDDENSAIVFPDQALMGPEEYGDLYEDGLLKFYYERIIPRKYGFTDKEDAINRMVKASKAHIELNKFVKKVSDTFEHNYGVARGIIQSPYSLNVPLGLIMFPFRGIKGMALDMRRCRADMEKVLDILENNTFERTKAGLASHKEVDSIIFPWQLTSLVHTLLSRKDFDRYIWPYFKKYLDEVAKNDQIGLIFMEGSIMNFIDHFQDIPAGHFILMPEMDDIAELKKLLPNLSMCGGMPTYLLGNGTKEQCVDKAKQLIDEVGYDGKFIMCTDKMLAYPHDAKGENLLAVNQFVREYGVYKN
jgi:hypothetical protein